MPSVGFSSNFARVREGDSGRSQVTLTLVLSDASTNPVTVTYTTMLKTYGDATPGLDYVELAPTEVTFAPGELTQQITLEVMGDQLYEADEIFYVDLISASGATLVLTGAEGFRSPWQAVYITNDDQSLMPTVGFSSNFSRVAEGNSGRTQATLTLSLSAASTSPVTVTYSTMLKTYGDATPGVDYLALAPTDVTFAPGELTKQITVEVIGDTLYEADEIFYVDLLSATGASLVLSGAEGFRSSWQAVYITNDDASVLPTVGFNSNFTRVTEGNSGRTQATLTLLLSAASTAPVTVKYTTLLKTYGDATPGVDYVAQAPTEVTFAPGELTKQITVEVLGDSLYEADENFYVDLLSPTGATLVISGAEGFRSPWQAVYITNDDPASSVPNQIKGSAANERWYSTAQNDQIDGGAGSDTVIWGKNAQSYALSLSNGQVIVKDITGQEGTDTLTSIEKLQFADKTVVVESQPHGSYADLPVGLYQFFITAFNAAPGVTYMDQLAAAYRAGMSVKQIVDVFTTKSQFTDVYPTSLSHGQLAQALVNNIVKTSASDVTKQQAVKDITDAMDQANWTVGQVIYQVFGNLASFAYTDATWGNTAKQFANEIAVAKTYTDTLSQSTTDLATLRSVMAPVSHLSDVSTPDLQITLIGQALMQA